MPGQHSSDSQTFRPANIFATTRIGSKGENMTLKCSIVGLTLSKYGIIYLCKDGTGVRMRPLGGFEGQTFNLHNVTELNSGNYSCVYSNTKVEVKKVRGTGITSVYIQIHSQSNPGNVVLSCQTGM